VEITSNNIGEDIETVNRCTEYALGFRTAHRYTIEYVFRDLFGDIVDSIDPEYQGPIFVNKKRVDTQAFHTILNQFANYFEFLRQSLRNIIQEINLYYSPTELLCRESFWRSFMKKAMERIENQLWDFKETLEMWHIKLDPDKEKAEVNFCEDVAGFANAKGGALIIGVTDKPRRILGIPDLENKLNFSSSTLGKHIDHSLDFVHFQTVLIKEDGQKEKTCLVIAIAQTRDVIGVMDEKSKFSYPIRSTTGVKRVSYDKIKNSKASIKEDNFNFVSALNYFLHD
jgi:hypothetical protein